MTTNIFLHIWKEINNCMCQICKPLVSHVQNVVAYRSLEMEAVKIDLNVI